MASALAAPSLLSWSISLFPTFQTRDYPGLIDGETELRERNSLELCGLSSSHLPQSFNVPK